jgi:taurine dioxygenase
MTATTAPGPQTATNAPATSYRTIDVTPLTAAIGAIVEGVDLRGPLPNETRDELRRAVREHLVVFVRDQELSDAQHIAAAAHFGPPNVYPVTRARGFDEPLEFIEDGPDSPPKTDLWHTDAAFLECPPDFAMLQVLVVPPTGGDTMWCSLYAAYESLSPVLRGIADGLEQDLHPGEHFRRTVELQFGEGIYEQVADEFQGARHPLVRIHPETGRPALFLCGAFVRGITGMHADESALLYDAFRRRLDDPNGQCRWRWQKGDVAIWDERCTNHRGLADHFPQRRRVRRCTMGAGRPIGPDRVRASRGRPA